MLQNTKDMSKMRNQTADNLATCMHAQRSLPRSILKQHVQQTTYQ